MRNIVTCVSQLGHLYSETSIESGLEVWNESIYRNIDPCEMLKVKRHFLQIRRIA